MCFFNISKFGKGNRSVLPIKNVFSDFNLNKISDFCRLVNKRKQFARRYAFWGINKIAIH